MKTIIALLSLLSVLPLQAGFDMERDGLCFKNADPALRQFGPLGKLGNKKGICQGMSGIVAAFHENARFAPNKNKLDSNGALRLILNLRRLHSGDCSKRIEVSGYANLQEFCNDHKEMVMKQAMLYNTDIAIREISWKLADFLSYQDNAISSDEARTELHRNLQSISKDLNRGRWPLLLYYSHAVAVHSLQERGGEMILGIYDSNYSNSREIRVPYDWDGLPMAGQKMLWNISPDRMTTPCW